MGDGPFTREVPGPDGLHIIPLSAVSAKTPSSPPVTYWDRWGHYESRDQSIWPNLRFSLTLRQNRGHRSRHINLFCEPLYPLGRSQEFMEITWYLSGSQAVLTRTTASRVVDLRVSALGTVRTGPIISPPEYRRRWTTILDNLRDALRRAGSVMDLRVVLERQTDMDVLRSFFAETWAPTEPRSMRGAAYQNYNGAVTPAPAALRFGLPRPVHSSPGTLTVAVERRRPQTNPQLDSTVFDPFPGVPVPLAPPLLAPTEGSPAPAPASTSPASTRAETSQAMAALQLSDAGGSPGSSSSAWSFLAKSREVGAVSPSSESSSSELSSSSAASASASAASAASESVSPVPEVVSEVQGRRRPVVVKSESESSDVEVVSAGKSAGRRKKRGSEREGEGSVGKPEKRKKKKRREVVESSGAEAETVESDDERLVRKKRRSRREKAKRVVVELSDSGGEVPVEALDEKEERRRRRRERRRLRREAVDLEDAEIHSEGASTKRKGKKRRETVDLDEDIEMHSEGAATRTKKSKTKTSVDSLSTLKEKKKKKGKSKETQPSPSPSEPPETESESRRSLKRKHPDSDSDDGDSEAVDVKRELLKKRLVKINLEKHELRVEEEELKAKLKRLDFTSRKMDQTGMYRAHCVCSACGKYGHRKNSTICEMYPVVARRWR